MNIPIVFAINNSYIKQLATVITSIIKNGSKQNIYEFFVMHRDISDENIIKLNAYVQSFSNAKIEFINMESIVRNNNLDKLMSKRKNYNHISTETYYRFYIPELFYNYDKILYLDADILVLNDVADLYRIDLGENLCGAIQDFYMDSNIDNSYKTDQFPELSFYEYLKDYLGMSDTKYFNAGIMLFDIKKCRETNITSKLWDFAEQKAPLEFQDQDVLNAVMENNVKFLDYRWNTLKGKFHTKKPYIYHFIGAEKPWIYKEKFKYNYSFINKYWQFYKQTPFFEKKDIETKKNIDATINKHKLKNIIQSIFSVRNYGKYKILTLLGLNFYFKRQTKRIKLALHTDKKQKLK